ncbi:NHL repeat containing protein [Chrysochromulina tobinii]|uniref:NHL repeat containing protein n=1 Tax=Chrysochromulina tobinii TaxID=1460289 RepID=A0A0M0JCL0_9EUKA|nr:NHL repeat containing protein [Chrysochromulina tobinii]|eukprot:KOO24336.1 NHL repeat containing protein [Chrysochromulina sp. CCMP291]
MVQNKGSFAIVTYDRTFGESGRGNGQYRLPRHLCALPDGHLCISDSVNQRLQVITQEGDFVRSIGEPGSGNGQLRGPCGIACENQQLFVVEGGNHRVQKLALGDGAPLGKAGSHGSKKTGELWCPHGVCINKGQAFVADYINGRVVVYDIGSMEHVRTFGARGSKEGELEYPCGIAVKGEEVFVAELGNHRISVFTKKGNFERILGGEGKEPGRFFQPRSVIIVKGWLLVTEPKRVTIMSPDVGEPQQTLELPGAGQLWGACKDEAQTRVFVTDIRAGHARIFVLNVVGNMFDDGAGGKAVNMNAAAAKAAEAAAKLKEWKEQKAAEAAKKEVSGDSTGDH